MLVLGVLLAAVAPSPVAAEVEDADSITELLAQSDYNGASHADILRLYQAIFDRTPDLDGAKYWIRVNNGEEDGSQHDVLAIAGFMSGSTEWSNTYNGTTDEQFVERVYSNVLDRDFDQSGFNYWLDLVRGTNVYGGNPDRSTLPRPDMVFYVTANDEFKNQFPFAATYSDTVLSGKQAGLTQAATTMMQLTREAKSVGASNVDPALLDSLLVGRTRSLSLAILRAMSFADEIYCEEGLYNSEAADLNPYCAINLDPGPNSTRAVTVHFFYFEYRSGIMIDYELDSGPFLGNYGPGDGAGSAIWVRFPV